MNESPFESVEWNRVEMLPLTIPRYRIKDFILRIHSDCSVYDFLSCITEKLLELEFLEWIATNSIAVGRLDL